MKHIRGTDKMINLVKVRTLYDNNIKYYRIDGDEALQKGAVYIGATRFGNDLMEIHCPSRVPISEKEWQQMLEDLGISEDKKNSRTAYEPVIHHRAKEQDISDSLSNKNDLEKMLVVFKDKSEYYKLAMKIMKLHYTYRREKLVCFYTAEQRVDFRDFVKDLGSSLKLRIEMFQISPKDAISLMDACGICGRRLCCLTGCNLMRLGSDKKNGYSPKSAGVCGKGRCCNSFEIPIDIEPEFPEIGGYVLGDEGMYAVRTLEPQTNTIILNGVNGEINCSLDDIYKISDGNFIRFEYHPEAPTPAN